MGQSFQNDKKALTGTEKMGTEVVVIIFQKLGSLISWNCRFDIDIEGG